MLSSSPGWRRLGDVTAITLTQGKAEIIAVNARMKIGQGESC